MKKELENYFEFVEKNHCTEILSDFEKMQFKEWKQRKLNQSINPSSDNVIFNLRCILMDKVKEFDEIPLEQIDYKDSELMKSYKQGRNNGVQYGILKAIEIIREYEKTLDKD